MGRTDSFMQALIRDILKKHGFGQILGHTTISFAEALIRAEMVEETGLLLFARLSALLPTLLPSVSDLLHPASDGLAEVLRLSDALRYHRLPV